MNQQSLEKIKRNEYDKTLVTSLIEEIICREFSEHQFTLQIIDDISSKTSYHNINVPLDEHLENLNQNTNSKLRIKVDLRNDSIKEDHTIAFARFPKIHEYELLFDINNFINTYNDKNLGIIGNIYNQNLYIQILSVIYHEIEHFHQYYKNFDDQIGNKDLKNIKNRIMYFDRQKQMEELAIINFLSWYEPKNTLKNRYLIPIEHRAEIAGVSKSLHFFEENNLKDLLLSRQVECFLKYLLVDYTIEKNILISPFEQLLNTYNLAADEQKNMNNIKAFIMDYIDSLDNYTLLSYGLPVDKDFFLEVQNCNNKNFESIQDAKQYIKSLTN